MTVYELDRYQWWFRQNDFLRWLFRVRPWRPATESPLPTDRGVIDTPINPSLVAEVDTPLPPHNIGPGTNLGDIALPACYAGYPSTVLPGTPYQLADSREGWIDLRWFHPKYGKDEPVRVPRPVDHRGQFHVEGNPVPNGVLAAGVYADKHICLYDIADGTYYECIGYVGGNVAGWGHFAADGTLLEGQVTNVSGEPIGPYLWDADSPAVHSVMLVVAGSDKADPSWPWFRRRVTFSEEAKARIPAYDSSTPEANFVRCVTECPILIGDHGGHNGFRYRAGAGGLAGLEWLGWCPSLSDLVPCDGILGP